MPPHRGFVFTSPMPVCEVVSCKKKKDGLKKLWDNPLFTLDTYFKLSEENRVHIKTLHSSASVQVNMPLLSIVWCLHSKINGSAERLQGFKPPPLWTLSASLWAAAGSSPALEFLLPFGWDGDGEKETNSNHPAFKLHSQSSMCTANKLFTHICTQNYLIKNLLKELASAAN